jgi:hypothetical protein
VNDPDDEATVSLTGLLSVGGEGFVQDGYEILQKLPLDGASVAKTYFRAYVLLPLALGAPLAVALWLMSRLGDCLGDDPGMPELALMLAPLLVWFGYFFALTATLIHRARGGRR